MLDVRDAQLETALSLALVAGWLGDDKAHTFAASRKEIRAMLADPALRLAILDAMHLDVLCNAKALASDVPLLVVRPRGDA